MEPDKLLTVRCTTFCEGRSTALPNPPKLCCAMDARLVDSQPLHIIGGAGGPGAAHMNLRRGPNICARRGLYQKGRPLTRDRGARCLKIGHGGIARQGRGRLLGMGSENQAAAHGLALIKPKGVGLITFVQRRGFVRTHTSTPPTNEDKGSVAADRALVLWPKRRAIYVVASCWPTP